MIPKFLARPAFRSMTVRTQILLGFGFLLGLILVVMVVGYIDLRILQRETENALESASAIRELSLQVENEFLLARQNEINFLSEWRDLGIDKAITQYAGANSEHLDRAREDLDKLDALVQASNEESLQPVLEQTALLRPLLDTYDDAFQKTIVLTTQRSEADGLEEVLKDQLNRLEADVRPLKNLELYQIILQIRANEKSYFGTKDQQYVDNVRLLTQQFISQVEASSPAELTANGEQLDAETLIEQITNYADTFASLVALEDEININTNIFREITTDITEITSQINTEGETFLLSSVMRLEVVNRLSSVVIFVVAVMALVIGSVVAFALSRQITAPLNHLSAASEKIGQGDFTQRVLVAGGRELATLAASFNNMAAQLEELVTSLEKRVEERTRAIETSMEVSRAVSTILDQQELVTAVTEQVRTAFDYYHVQVYLFDEAHSQLVMVGGTGEAGQAMLVAGHTLLPGQGVVGRAATLNQSVLIPDVSEDENWLPNALLPDTNAELAVPVATENEVFGVIDVQVDEVGGVSLDDVRFLEAAAGQIAVAIRNARLHEVTQRRVKLESFGNTISQKIQQAATLEEVLQVAAQELEQVLGAQRVTVQLGGNGHGRNH